MAYERKPFEPSLTLVRVYYIAVLVLGLAYGAFLNPTESLDYMYDLSMLVAVFQLATSAQALYLLHKRARITVPFCIITTAISLILSMVDIFVMHATSPILEHFGLPTFFLTAAEWGCGIAVIAYLATSRHARMVLNIDYPLAPEGYGNSWDTPFRERVRTWVFWRDITIYFIVFSFLGHWAEILFCRLIIAGVFMGDYDPSNIMLWDQWLFPFSAEGTALAMVVLLLHPAKLWLERRFDPHMGHALIASFLLNALICTSIDFLTGMVANQHYELWDYRRMPFNFMGQVCLQNSMVYSIAATLIVWVFYPMMDRFLRRLPRIAVDTAFFGLVGFYAFEFALHFLGA